MVQVTDGLTVDVPHKSPRRAQEMRRSACLLWIEISQVIAAAVDRLEAYCEKLDGRSFSAARDTCCMWREESSSADNGLSG